MKNRGIKRVIPLLLTIALIFSMTGCQFSASSSRPAKPEDVKELLDEISSLESFTARLSVSIEAENDTDATEIGPKLMSLFDINTSDLLDTMTDTKIARGTILACDIDLNKEASMAKVNISSGNLNIPIIYDGNTGYIGLDAFLSMMGIGSGNNEMTPDEKQLIENTFGSYKYIKGDIGGIEELASIVDLDIDTNKEFGSDTKITLSQHKDSDTGTEKVYTMQASKQMVADKLKEAGLSDDISLSGKKVTVKMYVGKQEENKIYTIKIEVKADDTAFVTTIKYKDTVPVIELPSENEVMDTNSLFGDSYTPDLDNNLENASNSSTQPEINSTFGNYKNIQDDYVEYIYDIEIVQNNYTSAYKNLGEFDSKELLIPKFNEYAETIKSMLSKENLFKSIEISTEYGCGLHAYSTDNYDSSYSLYSSEYGYNTVEYYASMYIDGEYNYDYNYITDNIEKFTGLKITPDVIKEAMHVCKESGKDSYAVYLYSDENEIRVYGSSLNEEESYWSVSATLDIV